MQTCIDYKHRKSFYSYLVPFFVLLFLFFVFLFGTLLIGTTCLEKGVIVRMSLFHSLHYIISWLHQGLNLRPVDTWPGLDPVII